MSSHPIPTHLTSLRPGHAPHSHRRKHVLKEILGYLFLFVSISKPLALFRLPALPPLILVAYATKYKLYPFSLVCVGSAVCLLCISWIKRFQVTPVFPHHE